MTSESFVDAPDQLRPEILRICIRLLESPDLTIDDDFFDKGGDSLLATELMLELRQLTGKALPDSLLFESSTVRALAERLGEKEAPRPKPVVRVGAASDGTTPLFFFHGDWTRGGFYVEHLARKLGPRVSLIAVAPHGPGGEPIPASIEEMAADRLPEILAAQPTGPYRLAGHCVGGIVAFETARLLMKLNHRVELAMIDSPRVVGGQVLRTPGADGRGNPGGEADPAATPDDIPVRPALPEFDWGFEAYESRLSAYSPTPLPVRLLVLASEYDGRDWVRLSGDGDLVELPGRHFDLVTTRINDLARSLSSWLAGNRPTGLSARPPVARADNSGTSSVGSGHREPSQSLPAEQRNRPPEIGGVKYDFLLRPLKRLFSQDRG
jgi:oxalate---CoA ligase